MTSLRPAPRRSRLVRDYGRQAIDNWRLAIDNSVVDEEVNVTGVKIFLRELIPSDASEEYAHWLNDPEVNQYLETHKATVEELKAYIKEKRDSDSALFFGIFWKENGKHIGNVKLEPIDRDKKEATMGILIGDKDYWGRGVATEATNLVCDYAFEELGIEEVCLGVIAENKAAIHVYEKCGFQVEEVKKNAVDHGGVLCDQVMMRRRRTHNTKLT